MKKNILSFLLADLYTHLKRLDTKITTENENYKVNVNYIHYKNHKILQLFSCNVIFNNH